MRQANNWIQLKQPTVFWDQGSSHLDTVYITAHILTAADP